MRRSALLGIAVAALVAVSSAAAAAALRWKLGLKHDTPSWVRVPAEGGKTRVAWYMTYAVENRTGEERKPTLRIEIRGPKDAVYRDSCDAAIKAATEKKTGAKDLATASDLRKDGVADGASKSCVATFSDVDDHADALELRIYGLMDPVDVVQGKRFNDIRYWQVKYERKGDEFRRAEDPWKAVSSGWVVEKREALPEIER